MTTCALIALLAHPDDEFAIFPWLRSAVEQGRQVHCVWLTDGGMGGQSVGRRQRESIQVLSRLGLDPARMHFVGEKFNIPDGGLYRRLGDVVVALKQCAYLDQDSELLIPAWEGGHHDHDAGHLVGLALGGRECRLMKQYSMYHGEGLNGPWFKVLSPLRQNGTVSSASTTLPERLGYVARCLQYPSQWKSFAGLLPFYFCRMLQADAFVLQPVDPRRTAMRPHPGALLYERRGGPSWEDFAQVTKAYRWESQAAES